MQNAECAFTFRIRFSEIQVQMHDSASPQALYRGGSDLTPRLGIDLLLDPTSGLLRQDRGISLFDNPALIERFGGAYRVEFMPKGLRVAQRGRNLSHYELAPAEPMSFERCLELLAQVVLRSLSERA
jgi:hypothetical protein